MAHWPQVKEAVATKNPLARQRVRRGAHDLACRTTTSGASHGTLVLDGTESLQETR